MEKDNRPKLTPKEQKIWDEWCGFTYCQMPEDVAEVMAEIEEKGRKVEKCYDYYCFPCHGDRSY